MNAEQSTSIQQLNSRLFEIHNANSTFNQYYHMSAPFSAVVETYRSDLPQSYFKMAENPVKKEYLDFFPVFQNTASYQKVYALEERIVKTILSPSIGATFLINGLICRLFDLLSSETLFHISMVDIDSGNDFLLFTKLTHLLEDSDGRLSRRDLSKLLNYSGDYLNRISRKYSGMTLFEYGMTFCLRKAEYYLLKTDVSVSEIARLLGFTNRSHFYRVFKGKHGMTPKEYRIKYRRWTQGENIK